jgi:hypothetical protein
MRRVYLVTLALTAVLAGGAVRIVQDQCGPFTDVTPGFCPYVLELYYLGITVGTSATTFSPDDPLTRGQAAVFVAKGLNQSLARSSRRAALGQWAATGADGWNLGLGITTVGAFPVLPASDGADVWVPSVDGNVSRVRASDGKLLETWTGASGARAALIAMGRVLVLGTDSLYVIDPTQPAGKAAAVATGLPMDPANLAFDGSRIWSAHGVSGSVAIVTPSASPPWPVTTLKSGFVQPGGILFDGHNVWVTDFGADSLLKLDTNGAIIQTVNVYGGPGIPAFDGSNIWVPDLGGALDVVRVSDGTVLTTIFLGGNIPFLAAFDGQRVLVARRRFQFIYPGSVSLYRASDFAFLGVWATVRPNGVYFADPLGICSDGINFWVTLDTGEIARF